MDSDKLNYLRNKYLYLYQIDNDAIDDKVDQMFSDLIGRDKTRFFDLLIEAKEKG